MPPQYNREILINLTKLSKRFSADKKHMSHALQQAIVSYGSFYRRLGHYDETEVLIKPMIANKIRIFGREKRNDDYVLQSRFA